jgi:hypothetical protein
VVSHERERRTLGSGPVTRDYSELLFEHPEALVGEGNAKSLMLALVPPGAEAELDAAARHSVDLSYLHREDARVTVGGRGHEGAEANRLCLASEARESEPRVGGAGKTVAVAHDEVVV